MADVLSSQSQQPAVSLSEPRPGADAPTVVEPTHGWRALDLRELWAYRELVYFLAWRDVKVRYKQTALGVAWVVLQPLAAMAIFSVIFGRLANLPSDNVPYPLFVFAGLVPWFYFANATSTASGSLVANTNLVSKVYFPRLAVPLAAVLAGLVDLAIGLGLELVLLAVFGVPVGARVLLVPVLVALLALTSLAVGVWLSALDVQYRDVRYAIPFLIQLWLFATPIVYPLSIVSERWRPLLALNPVAGSVEAFRWALLGTPQFPAHQLALGLLVVAALLATGLLYFRRMERVFADVI
jgi:lipopolysaccharide transport system permease protein